MKFSSKKIGHAFCCMILAMAGSGCVGTKVHFDDIPLAKADLTRGRVVESSCSGFQLLCLIPIGINDRQADAYMRLKQTAGSDFLTDIKITESWTWAYIGTVHKTRLLATAYPEKRVTGIEASAPIVEAPSLSKKLAELKALRESGALNDKEYEAARARAIEQFK